jgi:tetratricopeptide (TPR) repeat protein
MYYRVLGNAHVGTAASRNNLGSALFALGMLPEAREQFELAAKVFASASPSQNEKVAVTLCNLGAVLLELGEREDALRSLIQARDICTVLFGNAHPNTNICVELLQEIEESECT